MSAWKRVPCGSTITMPLQTLEVILSDSVLCYSEIPSTYLLPHFLSLFLPSLFPLVFLFSSFPPFIVSLSYFLSFLILSAWICSNVSIFINSIDCHNLMADWLTDWLTDWLLTDWLSYSLTASVTDKLSARTLLTGTMILIFLSVCRYCALHKTRKRRAEGCWIWGWKNQVLVRLKGEWMRAAPAIPFSTQKK